MERMSEGRASNVSIGTLCFLVKSSVSFAVLIFAELLPLIWVHRQVKTEDQSTVDVNGCVWGGERERVFA